MVQVSVVIPARDAGAAVCAQLPALCDALEQTSFAFEILCIDDASAAPSLRMLENLLAHYACLRVLRFDEPRGVSAAICAGVAAARGEMILVTAPGEQYPAQQIPTMLEKLSRGDLVFGVRSCGLLTKTWRRLMRSPRWLLLGLEVRDPDCLFWAARREAVAGLQLARGMFRYLPWLVSLRGYRVSEMKVEFQQQLRSPADSWPNPLDFFATWWLKRRWRPGVAREIARAPLATPLLKIAQPDADEPDPTRSLDIDIDSKRDSA